MSTTTVRASAGFRIDFYVGRRGRFAGSIPIVAWKVPSEAGAHGEPVLAAARPEHVTAWVLRGPDGRKVVSEPPDLDA